MPFPILWGLKCPSTGKGGCSGKKKKMAHAKLMEKAHMSHE